MSYQPDGIDLEPVIPVADVHVSGYDRACTIPGPRFLSQGTRKRVRRNRIRWNRERRKMPRDLRVILSWGNP